MSKKSRKRNKKILAALAAGLGAAALAKGKKGAVTGVVNPNAPKTDYITKKAIDAAPDTSGFQTRFKTKIGNKWVGPNEARGYAPVTGVTHPILGQTRTPPGNMRRFKGGGIAKRGMGAAFKSGGRVKSMGIAKRGGGAAKR